MAVQSSNSQRWDVALFGDVFIDHVLTGFTSWPQPGEEVFASKYVREAGGGAVNTACALARLGLRSTLAAAIGRDDTFLPERLKAFAVDTYLVQPQPEETGTSISVSHGGERSFFSYHGANRALPDLLHDEGLVSQLQQARHVHIAHCPKTEIAVQTIPRLRASGCTVSLDVGWHPEFLHSSGAVDLIRSVSVFLPNESEAAAMTVEQDPDRMLDSFARCGVEWVVIKLGASGAVMLHERRKYRQPAISVEVIDTTGAGDAFDAGFIYSYLRGDPPGEWLRKACLCGSLSTRVAGGLNGLPAQSELENYR